MYNIILLKSVIELQYIMKSVISKDIIRLVTSGIEALCNIPSNLLLNSLTKFNRERYQVLIGR
jgi:hypothetical protein